MNAINLFMNTDNSADIITREELLKRYTDINETDAGFEEYLKDGCTNGLEAEYRIFVIWTAYSEEADITFYMADDDEENTECVYWVWGTPEEISSSLLNSVIKENIIKWQNI